MLGVNFCFLISCHFSYLTAFLLILMNQAVNDAISCGSILKWLRSFALEQLAELSSNILNYLLHDTTLKKEAVVLLNPLLQMIVSLSKISQKRKICLPHFTLSMEGLLKIYQLVDQFHHAHVNSELALEAILMTAPPVSIFLMVFSLYLIILDIFVCVWSQIMLILKMLTICLTEDKM